MLVPKLTIKAFDKGILGWLTGLNETQFHTRFFAPEKHRLTRKLGSVIANNALGKAARFPQLIQEAGHLIASNRHRHLLANHLP